MAPVTTTGFAESTTRSQANAVSSIVSVPWTTTTPSVASSVSASRITPPRTIRSAKEKWLAGVSPRSIG
jgi:hypothetical protein